MRAASFAAAVGVLALAGCGGSSTTPQQTPKALFISTCGMCHVLADAGTAGTAGPALDSPRQASQVLDLILHGRGAMPGGLLSGRDAAAVAAYVAAATK